MQPIDFLYKNARPGEKLLADCWANGFGYEESAEILSKAGWYVPRDQFDAYMNLIDIQVSLTVGDRAKEGKK
jgi:hypothetical protein